jgi:hypothetical protein
MTLRVWLPVGVSSTTVRHRPSSMLDLPPWRSRGPASLPLNWFGSWVHAPCSPVLAGELPRPDGIRRKKRRARQKGAGSWSSTPPTYHGFGFSVQRSHHLCHLRCLCCIFDRTRPRRLAILRLMSKWVLVVGLALCCSCGGAVGEPREDTSRGGALSWAGTAGLASGSGGAAAARGGSGHGGTVRSSFVETTCPNVAPPSIPWECDPFGDGSDCDFGEGCFPVTVNASRVCESESYRVTCLPAGLGEQWAPCEFLTDCAPGFTCVVTGQGTECLQMCDPAAPSACPHGLFCDGVDLHGIGICY